MTSYADLVGWVEQGKTLRRLHYLWGDEYALIEHAVDLLKDRADVGEVVSITATGKNDSAVWNELYQYPAGATVKIKSGTRFRHVKKKRHVVVRDAHQLRDVTRIQEWQSTMHLVSACLVGDRTDFDGPLWRKARRCPRGHPVDDDRVILSNARRRETRYCPVCREARKQLVKSGRIVRCGTPTTDKMRLELTKMVAAQAECSSGIATELLLQCEWSAGRALEALRKLELLGIPQEKPLTEMAIKAAVVRSVSGDFVEALRRGDRKTAAALASSTDPDSVPGILTACERWLGQAQRGMSAVRAGRGTAEIVRLLDVSWGEAELLRRNAGRYSPTAISRATEALAAADQAWHRDRGRVGVLELLALQW